MIYYGAPSEPFKRLGNVYLSYDLGEFSVDDWFSDGEIRLTIRIEFKVNHFWKNSRTMGEWLNDPNLNLKTLIKDNACIEIENQQNGILQRLKEIPKNQDENKDPICSYFDYNSKTRNNIRINIPISSRLVTIEEIKFYIINNL